MILMLLSKNIIQIFFTQISNENANLTLLKEEEEEEGVFVNAGGEEERNVSEMNGEVSG